ncbi:hypothetical protein BGZ60DRAFT_152113 [Tricladium varicosporioides]|nr:hypothetical protein BGZ60DRAFT_152113 [Hymenoscyphus varicosporioides]
MICIIGTPQCSIQSSLPTFSCISTQWLIFATLLSFVLRLAFQDCRRNYWPSPLPLVSSHRYPLSQVALYCMLIFEFTLFPLPLCLFSGAGIIEGCGKGWILIS